jgi:GT2 family glycosyltransferase
LTSPNHKLTFIILNYKSSELVKELVGTIVNFDENLPICIVDNSSEIEKLNEEVGKFSNVKILNAGGNLGYARGNNVGLNDVYAHRPTEFVCICNPDIRFDRIFLERLISLIDGNSAPDFFGVEMVDKNGRPLVSQWKQPTLVEDIVDDFSLLKHPLSLFIKGGGRLKKKARGNIKQDADVISGAFFVAKLDIFAKVNFFDDRTFLFCEERILAKRLEAIGVKRQIMSNLTCTHTASTTIKKKYASKFSRHYLLVSSRFVFYRFYSSKLKLLIYSFSAVVSLTEKFVFDTALRFWKG